MVDGRSSLIPDFPSISESPLPPIEHPGKAHGLQSECERLAEHQEKIEVVTEVGRKDAVNKAGEEMILEVVLNGEKSAVCAGASKDEEKVMPSVVMDETAALLTNGEDMHSNISHSAAQQNGQPSTNGFLGAPGGPVGMQLGPLCCVGGEESAQASNANIIEEEEEEEEAVVMRAECVIITDEGDDIPEVQTFYVHDEKSVKVIDGLEAEASEMVIKTETVSVTFSELDKNLATEAQPTVEDKDIETHSDVHEEPALEHLQAPANALEGAAVALVPVYSEAPSSSFSPKAEAEEEAVVHVEDAAFVPGQFQEVSLADCQGNHRTAAGPGEQEPLLSEVKVSIATTEPAGAQIPSGRETESREGVGQAPKRKACQCCSVM
ncbi:paralemmin-3 isoform X2 [Gouania willdenowi]|uniref:paralemmin-3 isoform X2 n=1 Tax=Gouania willdenowi TaxID=441366 RepID=UPI0010568938|nr:uncharacterized protein LOC114471112 isoform X2 [Gouania willdenowi]